MHRMVRTGSYPPLVGCGDEWPLHRSLQPRTKPPVAPTEAFPAAGYWRDGLYWGIPCDGCYVPVCFELVAVPLCASLLGHWC